MRDNPVVALNGLGIRLVAILALLLIPTLALFWHCMMTDASISGHISTTWHAWLENGFQQFGLIALGRKFSQISGDLLAWLVTGGSVWIYWQGYRLLKKSDWPDSSPQLTGSIFFWALLFGALLVFVVPFHSRDIYGYINRGAQQAFYGLNPYLTTVGEMPNWQRDTIFQNHWLDNPCPYGFFYAQWAKLLALIGGHHFFLTFLTFKTSNVLVHLLTMGAILKLGERFNLPRPWLGVYLYGWNPLILIHLLANGHNDGLLALLLLASLALLLSSRWVWAALPVLTLSALTKYASLLAGPLWLVYLFRQKRYSAICFGLLVSGLLVVLLGWPYLQDFQHLPWDKMSENAGKSQHSLNALLSRVVFYSVKPFVENPNEILEMARIGFKWLFAGGFLLFYGWLLCWFACRGERQKESLPKSLVLAVTAAMLIYLVFASAKFHAWYIAMVFPLVFLLDRQAVWPNRVFRFALLLSLFQLISLTPLENIHIIGVLLTIGLPLWLTFSEQLSLRGRAKP